MSAVLGAACAAILAFAAGFHLFWAFGGRTGADVSLPQREDGAPIIAPTRIGAFLVGAVLTGLALLTLAVAGILRPPPVPAAWLRSALGLCALGFAARTVGDFRYIGVFRRVRRTAFARYDRQLYSPLSAALALGLAVLAWMTTRSH